MPAHAGPQCAAKMQSISETDAAATLAEWDHSEHSVTVTYAIV